MRERVHAAFRDLRRSEQGIALPVAILVTVIALALAAVPIMASVNTQSGDRLDQASDAALSAADAGANLAISRQTQMATYVTAAKPCVKKVGTKLEAAEKEANGWCPKVPTTGSETVGTSSFSYKVKPEGKTMAVVASGTAPTGSRTQTRRLLVKATSSGTGSTPIVFGSEGVVGLEWIKMKGSASIYGNAGSNGYIDWTQEADPSMPGCTQMRGEFRKLSWQTTPCPAVRETKTYPIPIVPTTNDNSRMFTAGGDTYTYSGGAFAGCSAANWQASWCPTSKVLHVASDSTVTLGGSVYVLCQLVIDGSAKLIMAAGAHTQFIFESPESCGLPSGTTQMWIGGSGSVTSASYSPSAGNYSVPGFYFVGSETSETKILMDGLDRRATWSCTRRERGSKSMAAAPSAVRSSARQC